MVVARNYQTVPEQEMNLHEVKKDSTYCDEYIEPVDTLQSGRVLDRSIFYSSSLPQRMHKSPTYETLIGIEEMD